MIRLVAIVAILAFLGASVAETEALPKVDLQLLGRQAAGARVSWFLISNLEVSWDTALKVCQAEGYRLVVINTALIDTSLQGFLASKNHTTAWTAGNDLLENGNYKWDKPSGEEPFGNYANWINDRPPRIPDCACVSISAIKTPSCGNDNECIGQYKWNEEVCALRKKFVCELVL